MSLMSAHDVAPSDLDLVGPRSRSGEPPIVPLLENETAAGETVLDDASASGLLTDELVRTLDEPAL